MLPPFCANAHLRPFQTFFHLFPENYENLWGTVRSLIHLKQYCERMNFIVHFITFFAFMVYDLCG